MQTLREMGHNTDKLWADIKSAIIKTLLVVAPYLARNYHASTSSHRTGDFGIGQQKSANESIAAQKQTPAEKSQCFELLGFDVIIDRKLKPYILEVNHSPSLTCDADIDLAVKQGLLCDTLDVIKISSAPRARKHYMRLTKKLSTLRLTRAVTASITANNPQSKLQQRSKSSINDTDDSSDSTGDSSGNDDNQDCCSEMEDEDAGSDSSSECGEESSTGDEHGDGSQAKRITTSEMTLLSPCVGKYERLYPPVQPNPIYDQILAAAEQQIALESHHTKSTSSRLAHLDAKQKREEEERIRMEQIKQQMRERNHQLATLFQAKKLSSSAMRSKMQETSWVRRKSKFEQKMSSNRTLLSLSQIDLGSDLDFQRYK
jgi:hypothetical protein